MTHLKIEKYLNKLSALCVGWISFGLFLSGNALAIERRIFSIDLIRHGERTPTTELPKSPYHWKDGLGALTERGRDQLFLMGQALRKEYIDQTQMLPKRYNSKTIFIRSTDTPRTQASAQALLRGLYPDSTRPDSIQIPVEVVPKKDDSLLLVQPSQNILSIAKVFFLEQLFWREKTSHLHEKLKKWSEASGLDVSKLDQLDILADNLLIREINQVSIPVGLSQEDAKEIITLDEQSFLYKLNLPEISEPTGLRFLKEVSHYFQDSIQEKSELRYVLFSGHDASIISVLSTLKKSLTAWPPFASRLNFSLFEDEGRYFVGISYNGKLIQSIDCANKSCEIIR